MGLKTRMAIAISLLFALLFAFFMAIVAILEFFGYITGILLIIVPIIFTLFVVFLQWGISPYIIRWIYKIRWGAEYEFGQRNIDFIRSVCAEKNIPTPRIGIVDDDNPNAFTFGWTRNKAHLVLTRGIFKYCDEEERKAVIAHEVGHISNNDFVIMTVVGAVPLIFYVIFRGCINILRYSKGGDKGKGQAMAFVAFTALLSFIVYILSQYIALLISRYREYYADEFSARNTRNPNALSTALIKIAYGMATEGLGMSSEKKHQRHENVFGIFNASSARALTAISADRNGNYTTETIKKSMAWDLWNPWAFFMELGMTHPLPAKRINALCNISEEMGQAPIIKFDLEKPECYWDDFLKDIFAKYSFLFAIPIGIVLYLISYNILYSIGSIISLGALFGFLYLMFYRYPGNFKNDTVSSLLQDPKASPIKGKAVRLKGKIIGRGNPGLFFSEDLKLDDGTGLILLNYHQIARFVDLLIGIFATEKRIGREVEVDGWYRRAVIPYLDIYKMYENSRTLIRIWTQGLYMTVAFILMIIGFGIIFLSIY
ncbi:MAG: zinc metalloprotease HtpX [Candidatus Thermoplasmatota archaeon]